MPSTSQTPSPIVEKAPVRGDPSADLLGLLLFIQTFYNPLGLETAINSLKAEEPGADLRARWALLSMVRTLLVDAGGGKVIEAFDALGRRFGELDAKVSQLLSQVSSADLGEFLVPGPLKARYEREHAPEKQALAAYIAGNSTFFSDQPARAFVPASVTAIHLARELSARPLPPGSLFYTNSIALPLILLQNNGNVSVYTLCGAAYDHLCGGWLPRDNDHEARVYLKSLFEREQDPLRDAYVTPMAVASDQAELCFTRPELLPVVGVLSQFAPALTIMTFSSRVFPTLEDALSNRDFLNTPLRKVGLGERLGGGRTRIVIARDQAEQKPEAEYRAQLGRLRDRGLEVHWQDPKGQWQADPAPPAGG
ncbi:MAG: hypothetical protein K2X87_28535 [Gemmataceae bacterium]|nr:hypothetical protein [Gemmataceae bacterium]